MTRVSTALIALIFLVAPLSAQRPTSDWTQWRGVNRDGVAAAPSDAAAWPAQLTQKWKLEVGLGYATPLVVGNRIYQFARKGEREVMMAVDADSGKVLWETVVGGIVMTSTITYAVNGKQYVAILTGDGQSVTAGPLSITKKAMAPPVRGHNSVVVFALP